MTKKSIFKRVLIVCFSFLFVFSFCFLGIKDDNKKVMADTIEDTYVYTSSNIPLSITNCTQFGTGGLTFGNNTQVFNLSFVIETAISDLTQDIYISNFILRIHNSQNDIVFSSSFVPRILYSVSSGVDFVPTDWHSIGHAYDFSDFISSYSIVGTDFSASYWTYTSSSLGSNFRNYYPVLKDVSRLDFTSGDGYYGGAYHMRNWVGFVDKYQNTFGINIFTSDNLTYRQSTSYYLTNSFTDNEYFDNGYSIGYDSGYSTGVVDGTSIGYNDGYNVGNMEGYNNGYSAGLDDSNAYSFNSLIGAVIDVPVSAFTNLLNFELLGVNILGLVTGLLTLAVLILIVKLCLGGK